MKLNEMLKVLSEHGHPLTRASLYRAGVKNGFLTREPYGNTTRYIVNEEIFKQWLTKATTEVPDDMISLNEASKRLGITYSSLKAMCNSGELESFNYGAGNGVTYVRLRDAEVLVSIHKQNN